MLTLGVIQRLAPSCDAPTTWAALSAAAEEFAITDMGELAMWLAQLSVESGGFVRLEENLSYSAERLVAVWPSRFPNLAVATPYMHNPRALAEKVYGGRADLGNNEVGDGWRFRGRGYIQTTGRTNYGLTSAGLGLDLMTDPDQLSRPAIAARAAGFFWDHHDLGPLARAGDISGVTRKINGGLIGLADRQAAFMRARSILGETVHA
jgi:putative chitinase